MLFDIDALGAQDAYKLLVATITPRPIAWVVTQDAAGVMNAAAFSFFNAVSGHPPVVVIGIGGRAPGDAKDTGNNIRATGQFVVNLVSHANAAAMNVTAIDFPPEVDELEQAGLATLPSVKVAPPRIADSPVAMECQLLTIVDVAPDRAVVLGRVVAMHVRDDCVMDAQRCYIDTVKLDLVARMHGSGWYLRNTDRFELPRIPLDAWVPRAAE